MNTINVTQKSNEILVAIRDRRPFRSGSVRGHQIISRGVQMGRLPSEFVRQYAAERPTYVVMSYMTPIAWWHPDTGWTIPDVKYSVTTTRHQNIVKRAVEE